MGESYKYYFVMVICSFVRGNVMYILSKLISKKGMQIADFPKEILGVLVMVFAFTVLNCCFVILLSLEAGSEKKPAYVCQYCNFHCPDRLFYAVYDGTL